MTGKHNDTPFWKSKEYRRQYHVSQKPDFVPKRLNNYLRERGVTMTKFKAAREKGATTQEQIVEMSKLIRKNDTVEKLTAITKIRKAKKKTSWAASAASTPGYEPQKINRYLTLRGLNAHDFRYARELGAKTNEEIAQAFQRGFHVTKVDFPSPTTQVASKHTITIEINGMEELLRAAEAVKTLQAASTKK